MPKATKSIKSVLDNPKSGATGKGGTIHKVNWALYKAMQEEYRKRNRAADNDIQDILFTGRYV